MKTAIHLPLPTDFYETAVIDLTICNGRHGEPPKESELTALYKKVKINLMNIVDITQFETTVEFIKDEDFATYQEEVKQWHAKNRGGRTHYVGEGAAEMNIMGNNGHPQPKMQTKKVKGTAVVYHNTYIRVIADDFDDFWEKYSAYLKVKALDFSGE